MNPLATVYLLMGILALASANSLSSRFNSNRNSIKTSGKATEWLSVSELESLPSMHEISPKMLEEMSVQEGADLLQKMCKY